MIIDVSIIYDGKNLTVNSEKTGFKETRISNVGLSKDKSLEPENKSFDFYQIEFIGENFTAEFMYEDSYFHDRDKGSRIYSVIDPFAINSFEPFRAFQLVQFFCRLVHANHKSYLSRWRMKVGLDRFELKLKIANYSLLSGEKQELFEKKLSKLTKDFVIEI